MTISRHEYEVIYWKLKKIDLYIENSLSLRGGNIESISCYTVEIVFELMIFFDSVLPNAEISRIGRNAH